MAATQQRWKEDSLEGLGKGSRVWFRSGERSWQQGTLQLVDGNECSVALDSPLGEGTGKVMATAIGNVMPANPALLNGVTDLTSLSFLNEPSILHALNQRYATDAIYTHAGPVLVAINPFKPVDLYTPEHVSLYVNRPAAGTHAGDSVYQPHIFLTADMAYKQMSATGKAQSILITGESGAGKTETTKFVMKYLAGLGGGTGMEDRVLETNPILEAFGNAKTVHNNNSSRFGKLIEIYFNTSHAICGALIQTYLLEKSRVVHQLSGERNYHIFYQLCRGASEEERADCRLPSADALTTFAYLSSSGCTDITGVDDAATFSEVKHAMHSVGISDEQQRRVWRVLAAVLWLGNVNFIPVGDSDSVQLADEDSAEALCNAAALLAVPEVQLAAALVTRRMAVGGERITRHLNMEAAAENRDALAKAVYESLFRWLVNQVNAALAEGRAGAASSLCILDIYGFECFTRNSFEQLCINYANERLQQQFAAHLFKLEQAVYEEEGVDWARVDFEDNQDCVNLIEARPPVGTGLLSLLDEECMFPKGCDTSFAAKLRRTHAGHSRFSFDARVPGDDFTIHHYAGAVPYAADRFLDKNRDALSPDLVALMAASSDVLAVALAREMSVGQERRGSQTVGARFRDQLRDLMARLDKTSLHFVRCIKPNGRQQPAAFDPSLALHQLRCCGILEVARIARAGYPTRYLHQEFAERYRLLLPGLGSGALPAGVTPLEVCLQLLQHFRVDPALYQVGRTKLFFRAGVLGQLEDRTMRMQQSALTVQATWRMLVRRREFVRAKAAAVVVQAHWRGLQGRREVSQLRRRHAAAVVVQAAYRGAVARAAYQRARAAAVCIQMGWRRQQLERRVAARTQQRLLEEAERRAQEEREAAAAAKAEAALRADQESYETIKAKYGVDGAEIQRVMAIWQQHGPEFQEFLSWKAAGGAAARAGTAAATAHAATAATADARVAELEARLGPYGELKSYVELLEVEVEELRKEAKGRTIGVGKHPSVISITAMAAPVDDDASTINTARYSQADSDDTVSVMSYSEDAALAEQGHNARVGAATARGRHSQSTPRQSFGRAGAAGAVAGLSAELIKKSNVFDDDASFIKEVREGVSMAPAMDPELEFKRLEVRYKTWSKDFKNRLKSTQVALKRSSSPLLEGPLGRSAQGSMTARSSHGDGSLTARLVGFARGGRPGAAR